MNEIHGKSILVRVSARFELARVQVVGIRLYGLNQLIREPTRVTSDSNTLIDLCVTNSPEKVTKSGVIHLGISDHSLVFLTRKAHHDRNQVFAGLRHGNLSFSTETSF